LAVSTNTAHHCIVHETNHQLQLRARRMINLSAGDIVRHPFCLKETYGPKPKSSFSFSFFSERLLCEICPNSSYPEHWLPGSFFFLSILTILIFFNLFITHTSCAL
jgi:hypothetical protein